MKIQTSELIGPALNWAGAKCLGTLGEKPTRCFDCKHHEERAIQDGAKHYCHHPEADYLDWEDSEGFGEGISADYGVHRQCPINDLTAEPYSTDWSQGGPIIERELLSLDRLCQPDEWRSALTEGDFYDSQGEWIDGSTHEHTGPTPLIAAMRCFVASKLGDEVEVPDELCKA